MSKSQVKAQGAALWSCNIRTRNILSRAELMFWKRAALACLIFTLHSRSSTAAESIETASVFRNGDTIYLSGHIDEVSSKAVENLIIPGVKRLVISSRSYGDTV